MDQHSTFTRDGSTALSFSTLRANVSSVGQWSETALILLHPEDGRHKLLTRSEQNYVSLNS